MSRRRPPRASTSGSGSGLRARSLREVNRTRLADDRDLDLAGVLQLLLDVAGDLVRHQRRALVVDVLGPNDHADLATGLHRVDLVHAIVAPRDLLQVLQTLDILLERLAAGAGTRAG